MDNDNNNPNTLPENSEPNEPAAISLDTPAVTDPTTQHVVTAGAGETVVINPGVTKVTVDVTGSGGSGGGSPSSFVISNPISNVAAAQVSVGGIPTNSSNDKVEDQAAPDTEQAVAPITLPPRPVSTAIQEAEVYFPHDAKSENEPMILPLPADTLERTEAAVEAMPNIDVTKTNSGNEWADMIYRSRYIGQYAGWFTDTVVLIVLFNNLFLLKLVV